MFKKLIGLIKKNCRIEKSPTEINVGKAIATLQLIDGSTFTISRIGRIFGGKHGWSIGGKYLLSEALNQIWITDSSGIHWNRNQIKSYTIEVTDYWLPK